MRFRDIGEISFLKRFSLMDEGATRRNPYSGEEVYLCPLAVALYDFIVGAELVIMACEGERGYKTICTDFNRARDIFRKKWPEEYMKLLD